MTARASHFVALDCQILRQKKGGKKVEGRDIRLAKEWNEYEEIPGTGGLLLGFSLAGLMGIPLAGVVIDFPDSKDLSKFTISITPGGACCCGFLHCEA
jgi:hypothetical protein